MVSTPEVNQHTSEPEFLEQLVTANRAVAPGLHGPIVAPGRGDEAVDVAQALAADRGEEPAGL